MATGQDLGEGADGKHQAVGDLVRGQRGQRSLERVAEAPQHLAEQLLHQGAPTRFRLRDEHGAQLAKARVTAGLVEYRLDERPDQRLDPRPAGRGLERIESAQTLLIHWRDAAREHLACQRLAATEVVVDRGHVHPGRRRDRPQRGARRAARAEQLLRRMKDALPGGGSR
jgi:hypothetical protein